MNKAQIYCTVKDIIDDLELDGTSANLFGHIEAASEFIEKKFGNFIPLIETRLFENFDLRKEKFEIDPLLEVTLVVIDENTVTDCEYRPLNREWTDGPYTFLYRECGLGEDIEITGKWGKNNSTKSTGLTVTSQTNSELTLEVSNGSLISAGMVLLIGDEQELVEDSATSSDSGADVEGAIEISDEEINVETGHASLLHVGETICIDLEDMLITKISGAKYAVKRGWNGTTKADHVDDATVMVYRKFSVQRGVNGTTAAAHSSAAINQYKVPKSVNYLCRQIAGLMRAKAESGWSGRSGSAETGETFYFNEFPRQIEDIQKNFSVRHV
jgi:hypothetical protein